jgi:putative ABC transport system permease protein
MLRVTLENLLARKFRLVLTSIAVILGVAFMAGTFVLTDTIGNVFDTLFANTTKGVDAVTRAQRTFKGEGQGAADTRPPVPKALAALVGTVPGVARAQGGVFEYALVLDKKGEAIQHQAPTFGTSWYPARSAVNQSLQLQSTWKGGRSRQPSTGSEVALDAQTADDGNFKIGDRVTITFLTVPPQTFRLTGVFEFGGKKDGLAGATLAAFTPTRAQEVMNRVGSWDFVEVRGAGGRSEGDVRDAIRARLPDFRRRLAAGGALVPRLEAITGDERAKEQATDVKDQFSFFSIFLLIFPIVFLFVGAFIIYNTFSITVAQRTRELGLLRALGASGRQVITSVALEALAVGLLSSIIGVVIGLGLVKPLEALLGAFGIELPSGPLDVVPRTVIVSIAVGTIVTFVSAITPARRAARVTPIAALRDEGLSPSSGRRRYLWGAAATVVGLLLLAYGLLITTDGNTAALSVGVAAAVVFVGVAMLSPLFAIPAAKVLTWPAERFRSLPGLLAQQNAMRNPRRTASTASALMIGLALVSLISIFGDSAKATIANAIDKQTHADFILSPKNFQPFSPEAASLVRARFRRAFGSEGTVVEWRAGTVEIDGKPNAVLGVTDNFQKASEIPFRRTIDRDRFRFGGVVISDSIAGLRKCVSQTNLDRPRVACRQGSYLPVRFPAATRSVPVVIAGIYTDAKALGPNTPDYIIGFDPTTTQWQRRFTDAFDSFVPILKPTGASTSAAGRIVTAVAKKVGGIEAENKTQFKDRQIGLFNQILGLVYVLLLFAVIIALIGIVNTLALSIYERTREVGLLRAVGMSRIQLRRMIRGEAVIVAVFGSLLGLAVGIVFGGAIVRALSSEGIEFHLPVGQLVIFVVLAGLAGLLAGTWPARRAARLDVLRAIHAQ